MKAASANAIDFLISFARSKAPYLLLLSICLCLVAIAHYFFEVYLYMRPCELCVYIRSAFLIVGLGAGMGGLSSALAIKARPTKTTSTLKPAKAKPIKTTSTLKPTIKLDEATNPLATAFYLLALGVMLYGVVLGIGYSDRLLDIQTTAQNLARVDKPIDPFSTPSSCKTTPTFAFGMPLQRLSPDFFMPKGPCDSSAPLIPPRTRLDALQSYLIGGGSEAHEVGMGETNGGSEASGAYKTSGASGSGKSEAGIYARGWYLVPSLGIISMARACEIAFYTMGIGILALYLGSILYAKRQGRTRLIVASTTPILLALVLLVADGV